MQLLRDLTARRFRDGAVARVLAMEFWTRGEAPTFEEFARSWTKAKAEEHRLLTPEYAYLTDLRHQRAGRRLEGLAQGQGEVRSGDACENRSRSSGRRPVVSVMVRATRARRHE